METLELRCALTQQYASTSCAFTEAVRLWSSSEKVLIQFSLYSEDMCIDVNCIIANQHFLLNNMYLCIINIC